ncbi:MAG: glutathione S-transferase N-terminal domain-containing protein [Gammaproteobacteria bacterium]
MTLYSLPDCAMSHCARIVLYEKGVTADIEYYDHSDPPEDLLELNPNGSSPTLIDRDLVLYDSRIIMEYLDERFPHPPLHQMDPVSRANARMIIKRIDEDWYQLLDEILNSGEKKSARAKKLLKESLIASVPVFESNCYFMRNEFSLVDCVLAPLLWRLPALGIDFPPQAEAINTYAKRLFARKGFRASLSDKEKKLQDPPKK